MATPGIYHSTQRTYRPAHLSDKPRMRDARLPPKKLFMGRQEGVIPSHTSPFSRLEGHLQGEGIAHYRDAPLGNSSYCPEERTCQASPLGTGSIRGTAHCLAGLADHFLSIFIRFYTQPREGLRNNHSVFSKIGGFFAGLCDAGWKSSHHAVYALGWAVNFIVNLAILPLRMTASGISIVVTGLGKVAVSIGNQVHVGDGKKGCETRPKN